jgi:hypothetical protein
MLATIAHQIVGNCRQHAIMKTNVNRRRQKWFGFLDTEYCLMMHRPVEGEYGSKKLEENKCLAIQASAACSREKVCAT